MNTRLPRSVLVTATLGLTAGGVASTAQAQPETGPQGLYSAQAILDSDAYLEAERDTPVGEVEDILLGEASAVQALVVRSDTGENLIGEARVVANERYRLETRDRDGETHHLVVLEATAQEFEALPVYDNDWWEQMKSRSRDAWQATGEGAQRALDRSRERAEHIGEGAESLWERTQEGAERAGERIRDALDDDNG